MITPSLRQRIRLRKNWRCFTNLEILYLPLNGWDSEPKRVHLAVNPLNPFDQVRDHAFTIHSNADLLETFSFAAVWYNPV